MRKLFRIFGILVASLVLLVVVAAIVLPYVVDANQFKPRIEQVVEDATGRELTIEGELSLSVFPWLGVELGATRLAQPEGFEGEAFARIEAVRVGVRLLPLLQKRLDVDRIELVSPVISLKRDAQGRTNWADLADIGKETSGSEATASGKSELPEIQVAGFLLDNGRVEFADAQAGSAFSASNLRVETGSLGLPVDTPVKVTGDVDMQQDGKQNLAMKLAIEGRAQADIESQQFALQDAIVSADITAAALPQEGNQPLPLRLSLKRAEAAMQSGTASFDGLQLELHDLVARVDAQVSSLNTAPEVNGSLNIPEVNLAALLARIGIALPEMRADDALNSFTLESSFAAGSESARFTSLDASMDATRLQGSAGIADFSKQAIRFDLAINSIDVDRYLTPTPEEPVDEPAKEGELDLDAIELPVELLRTLDVEGAARIGELRVMNLAMSNVKANVTSSRGQLRLNPFSADFYGGGYRGDIRTQVAGDALKLNASQDIQRFAIGPMLNDLAEIDRVSGSVSMQLVTSASGKTAGDWARSLGGTFKADASNGAIEGFNLWAKVREARAKFRNEPFDASQYPNRTEFADLAANGRFVEGEVVNDSVVAKLPFLGVQGSGRIQPLAKTMDYKLDVTVLDKPELAESMEELRGKMIPVTISGEIKSPKVRPDVAATFKARAKQEAEEAVEEKKEDIKKKLEDKLKDIF
ncbi:MAG: AsmA family protein [Gammaproteobacteria bacterium]|nr:AsmA family protein [Gammaproteobacteria bacterium]